MSQAHVARRYLVSGRVQGVGFRAGAYRVARGLELRGWVRNLPDGRVEACSCGAPDAMQRFEAWLRRGPAGARVEQLHVEDADEPPGIDGFTIR